MAEFNRRSLSEEQLIVRNYLVAYREFNKYHDDLKAQILAREVITKLGKKETVNNLNIGIIDQTNIKNHPSANGLTTKK